MIKKTSFRRQIVRRLSLTQRAVCLMLAIAPVTAVAANVTWDSSGNSPTAPVDGNGTWATNFANWTDGVADNNWATGNHATIGFNGTAGTITIHDLSSTVSVAGIEFDPVSSGNYTVAAAAGNTLTLTDPNILVQATSATITAPIVGSVGLIKTGPGILILGAANTYTGGTTVDGGTLRYTADNLTVGNLTFGATAGSANVSTLDLQANVTATGLLVQTNAPLTTPQIINIATGKTLTINGSVIFGPPETFTNNVAAVTTGAAVTGDTLVVNGGTSNFVVGAGRSNAAGGTDPNTNLDLSNLANFTYTATTGQFTVGGGNNNSSNTTLANTSTTITAAQLRVGDSGASGSGNNNPGASRMNLGAGANVVHVNSIIIGAGKSGGTVAYLAANTTGTLTVTGETGGASTANITIGNASSATSGSNPSLLDLSNHTAAVQGATVIIGEQGGATGGTANRGTVNFDTGTFTADSLQLAVNASGTITAVTSGTFTLGGPAANSAATGILTVNSQFLLADRTNSNAASGTSNGTFTINGGTANIHSSILDGSTTIATAGPNTTTLTLAGGTLNMFANNIGSAAAPITTINLTSGNLTNASTVAGNAINIGSAVIISGAPTYVLPSAGTLTSGLTTLTLGAGGGIAGGGASPANISGNVEAASGARITPGDASSTAGTLAFANNLTLDGGSTVHFKLSPTTSSGNDQVTVAGTLTLTSPVNVETAALGSGPAIGNTYTLFTYGTLVGNESSINVVGIGSRETFTIVPTATTPGSIQLSVGGSGPVALTWLGNTDNLWQLNGTNDWRDPALNPQKFFSLDTVTFDDNSTNLGDVQIVGNLLPGSVAVSANRNYKFVGSGSITGSIDLTKSGSGTLVVANNNTYTGNTTINTGVLQVGDGGANGSIGSGNITNNAALIFNLSSNLTISGVVAGSGTLAQNGAGVTTFANTANSFGGPITINAGAMRFNAVGSAGSNTITVNPTGTLLAGANIVNLITLAGGSLAAAGSSVTLSGDLTVSANSAISSGDAVTNTTTRDVIFSGTLHGSGNISVTPAAAVTNADASNGVRFRGTNTSDFTGNILVAPAVKFELQTTVAGPFSPINTGRIIATGGTVDLGNAVTGTYSEIILRNNSAADSIFGNDIQLAGTGVVIADVLGTSPADSNITMGNLQIGNNQTLATYFNSTVNHNIIFTSATLTGGTATLSPKLPGFGLDTAVSGNITLGNTSETASSNLTINGTRTVFFNGATNAFTGNLAINGGAVVFNPNATSGISASTIGNVTSTAATGPSLTVNANATLASGSVNIDSWTVNGTSTIKPGSGASKVNTLTIAGATGAWTGNVNISDAKLIIEAPLTKAATLAATRDQVVFGSTNAAGITSTALPAHMAIAVLDNAVLNKATFGGIAVDTNSILVSPELLGDSNADGHVDLTDLSTVLNNFGSTTPAWTSGNFDNALTIDLTDLSAVLNNFGLSNPNASNSVLSTQSSALPAPAPEPTTLALLTPLVLSSAFRRRRTPAHSKAS